MDLRVFSEQLRSVQNVAFVLSVFVLTSGCGSASVQDKVLHENSTDPIEIASNMLEGYVQGQPVGSEAEGYQEMITSVSTVDAAKGGELKTFLDSIDQTGRVDRKEAKRLFEMFRSGP
ncbi:MAG: hypothetical protein HN985_07065 [Planctomycetaceae bacterium]|jgi:hypothetical protein|nr:hypothetical protein [Planctomycetaceae bacterium]MBT6919465.1 hypothetical protein [Planctomycetaceae bacterium]MBT7728474.1 hypothetical protein [Planctomycetaceae bacterium]